MSDHQTVFDIILFYSYELRGWAIPKINTHTQLPILLTHAMKVKPGHQRTKFISVFYVSVNGVLFSGSEQHSYCFLAALFVCHIFASASFF